MNVKSFKLIPIHIFEKMDVSSECKENNVNERSVKDIVESNLEKTNFKPSKHYVADFKIAPSPQEGKGLTGHATSGVPIFLPNSRELPQYSRGFKLKTSFDKIDSILEDENIPEDLKIKLYHLFKQKYDLTRNINSDDDGTYDSDNDQQKHKFSKSGEVSILNKIVSGYLPSTKSVDAQFLADILVKSNIRWDNYGAIIYPKFNDLGSFDLSKLFKVLLYVNYPIPSHIDITARLIKPFADKLLKKNLIKNREVLNRIANASDTNFVKYVSW